MFLPAARSAPLSVPLPDAAGVQPGLDGTVLLAMDEPSIGRMLTRVFARAGLNVVWVTNMVDGLGWFQRHHADIALAFIDCHQSGEEGRDFCRQIRTLRPELPVLLAGGHDTQHSVDELMLAGPTVFIPKPYLPTELAWQLRGLLPAAA